MTNTKGLKKTFDPEDEVNILKYWVESNVYRSFVDSQGWFVIDIPPPYATGSMHVGGSAHYVQIDMVARYFRMNGKNVYFPWGVDRNGLPVELIAERKLNKKATEIPREIFLQQCKNILDGTEHNIVETLSRLGLSCDFDHGYKTDSSEYRAFTQATFIDAWEKGLVYEEERPVNWCPSCKTTIADAELDKEDRQSSLYYIKFSFDSTKSEGNHVIIATTRPELIGACQAVIYNPWDDRYSSLDDKSVIVPVYNYKVPIISHPYAKPEFGSGLVMVCSYGDQSDIRLFKELRLKPRVLLNEQAKMNENSNLLAGLNVEEAREKILSLLEKEGRLVKKEMIKQSVPVCWRCSTPIEYIHVREYYLKQIDFLEDILKLSRDQIKFFPSESINILVDWINSISSDWPISRRRFYGTELPIWYCKKCGAPNLPPPGRYYQPWREPFPSKTCKRCGGQEFIGEERTFDTWVDSSVSALYILELGRRMGHPKLEIPVNMRPQGIDIVRTWLFYSLLRIYQLTGKPAFKYVRLSGMGLDEHGRAMHRHLGNVVYPEPMVEKYGADAFRLWTASESKLGSNYLFSESRVAGARKFVTKLWNISRFILQFDPPKGDEYLLEPIDIAILEKLDDLILTCKSSFDQLDPFEAAKSIRSFVWNILADHYIEAVKSRVYNRSGEFLQASSDGAIYTLYHVLNHVIRLLAPIAPFVTEKIYQSLPHDKKSVHIESYPSSKGLEKKYSYVFDEFMQVNSLIWNYKKAKSLSLASPLSNLCLPSTLKIFEREIATMHKVRIISYDCRSPTGFDQLREGCYVRL
ncbi:MAG: valine--tRNA ligase [Nitrososphaeria archaeon]